MMSSWFDHAFMARAVLAGAMLGLAAPAIGTFLVMRRLSLMGESLGHSAFAGVAAGAVTGLYPPAGALIFSALVAVGIEKLRGWRRMQGDLAIAIFLYASLAIGLVLISKARGTGTSLYSYLFGSIVLTSGADLGVTALLTAVVLGTVALLHRELFIIALDEDQARLAGIPVNRLNLILAILTAVTVTQAMRLVGILLVASLMILPAAAAMHMGGGFRFTLLASMAFGVVTVLAGLAASYFLDLPPGGTVVMAGVATLLLTMGSRRAWRFFSLKFLSLKLPPFKH